MNLRSLLSALAALAVLAAGSAGAQTHTGTLTVATTEAGTLTTQLRGIVGGDGPLQQAWTHARDGRAVRISLSGGGPNCSLAAAEWLALPGAAQATLPPGATQPPGGLLRLATENCTGGGTATFTLTYPEPLARDTRYYKYGPTTSGGADAWFEVPITVFGNSLSFSVTDGELGDSDFLANGEIQDPGAILLGGPLGAGGWPGIPVLNGPLVPVLGALLIAALFAVGRHSGSSRRRLRTLAFFLAASIPAFDGHRDAFALPLGEGGAVASLSPALLVFRVTAPGKTSAPQMAILRNGTAGPVSIGTIAASEHFSQQNDCPAVLAAGAGCTITVRFQPSTAPVGAGGPILSSHQPAVLVANGEAQTLTLSGSGFAGTDVGLVDGTVVAIRIHAATGAELTVPGSLLTRPGLRAVLLRTAGGALSNPLVVAVDPASIPEPALSGTPWGPGATPSLLTRSSYLFSGTDPVQKDVQPGALRLDAAAGVLGYVRQRDGTPLAGVTVSVKDQGGIGWTLSRGDGRVDLVVNGGEDIVLEYRKPGYLPLQRAVLPLPQGYTRAPDVVMVPYDANVTPVETAATGYTVARGLPETDDSGPRQAAIFFPPGTVATLRHPDGRETTLTRFHARATEYTVGETGPQAMPGPLPENVAYTYAAELSLDEAVAAGASVRFNQKVALYVDNFIGFPVGAIVPVGWYDLGAAAWQAADNGRVIRIQSVAELGISDGERDALAGQYAAGTTLWRATMDHFSPWDCNWPYGPPPGAERPDAPPDEPADDEFPECEGCLINPVKQTLREAVPIVGTPYRLGYNSANARNNRADSILRIRLTPARRLPDALGVRATVTVGGISYVKHASADPDQFWDFHWDGRGLLAKEWPAALADIEIVYIYPAVYYLAREDLAKAWAQVGTHSASIDRERYRIELATRYQRILYSSLNKLPASMSVGGWSLDVQRADIFFDVVRGDGRRMGRRFVNPLVPMNKVDPITNHFLVPEEDGSLIYEFDDQGRHLRTLETSSGAVIASFGYDGDGRVASVADLNGRATRIERDGGGVPLAIVAPDGQRTVLGSSSGLLASITNPAGERYSFDYDGELLTRFTRPSGAANTYTYDADGRLTGDVQPQGGGWRIVREADDAHTTVTMTSAEGVPVAFDRAADPGGYASIGADGAVQDHVRTRMNATTTRPDGSVTTTGVVPYPIGGYSARASSRTTLPSGQAVVAGTDRSFGRIATVADVGTSTHRITHHVAGRLRTSTYDPATRTYAQDVGGALRSQVTLDATGRPQTLQVAGLAPMSLLYDPAGRLQTLTTSAGGITRGHAYTYHPDGPQAGLPATHTDPAGRTETFAWDAAGRLTDWSGLGGQRVQYAYDPDGHLAQATLPNGALHRHHRNELGDTTGYQPPELTGDDATDYTLDRDRRLVSVRLPGGQTIGRTYDIAGRLATESGGDASRSYTYLPGGRLASATVTTPAGITTRTLAYDGPLPTGITWSGPVAGTIGYGYRSDVLPERIQVGDQDIPIARRGDGQPERIGPIAYHYGEGGRLAEISAGTLVSRYTYTPFGEIASIDHQVGGATLWRLDYTWDAAGRLVEKRDTRQGQTYTWAYAYDPAARLTETRLEGETVSRYGYDANGNRLTEDLGAGEQTATVDAQDRLQGCGSRTYQYDPQGRRTAADCGGRVTRYRYDGLGQMAGVDLPDGTAIDYLHDATGERIGRRRNGVLERG